jgi:hypothetical protein
VGENRTRDPNWSGDDLSDVVIPARLANAPRLVRVLERRSAASAGWFPSAGLSEIPAALAAGVRATVAEQNGRLDFTKYMVVVQLPKDTRRLGS